MALDGPPHASPSVLRAVVGPVVGLLGASVVLAALNLVRVGLPLVAANDAEPTSCEAPQGDGASGDFARPPPPPRAERVSVEEALRYVGRRSVTFVDARSRDAFAEARIADAIHLSATEAPHLLESSSVPIPPENLVVTYCDGQACEHSEYLGLLLRDRHICRRVLVLEGGLPAWIAAGGPIERGMP